MSDLEGHGVHYFAKRVEDFRDKDVVIVGGGDSAVDWAVTLEPVAKQVTLIHRSKFRAHEATVRELEESTVDVRYPGYEVAKSSAGDARPPAAGRLQGWHGRNPSGARPGADRGDRVRRRSRPAQDVGLSSCRRIRSSSTRSRWQTSIPGVFAAGDICWYPAKFKLIATGAAEAVTAINHAVTYIDPSARLDPGHSTNIMAARG